MQDLRSLDWSRARPWLLSLLLILAWDWSGLDVRVMQALGNAQGFAWRDVPLLSLWLHARGQSLAVGLFVVLAVMVWRPWGPWRQVDRRARLHALLAVMASLLVVAIFKRLSLTSCPWDLQMFGGPASYVSHWRWGVIDGGGGRCFPSGHTSSAMGFLPAALPFLRAESAALQRVGRRWLWGVWTVGAVFALTQTLRGAHYPSHHFWSAWLCAAAGWLCWAVLQRRKS